MFSAIGGAMFTLQVGFMSPSFVGIVPSIEMVIFAAVGGRMSLVGAVYGTLLVNWGKSAFSESFPQLWLLLMGGLFIGVVMFFPNGLAGIVNQCGTMLAKLRARRNETSPPLPRPTPPADSSKEEPFVPAGVHPQSEAT
jgi:urea transport system permease protein